MRLGLRTLELTGLHLGAAGVRVGGGVAFAPLASIIVPPHPPLGTCEHCMRYENKTSDPPPPPPLTIFLNEPLC